MGLSYDDAKDMLGRKNRLGSFGPNSFIGPDSFVWLTKRPGFIEVETAKFGESAKVPVTVVRLFPGNRSKPFRSEVVDLTEELKEAA